MRRVLAGGLRDLDKSVPEHLRPAWGGRGQQSRRAAAAVWVVDPPLSLVSLREVTDAALSDVEKTRLSHLATEGGAESPCVERE